MNADQCCGTSVRERALRSRTSRGDGHSRTVARHCLDVAVSVIPGVVLALLPKCPACLAAYIAVGTGIGLSVSAATYLRMLLVTLCIASLSYVGARVVRAFSKGEDLTLPGSGLRAAGARETGARSHL